MPRTQMTIPVTVAAAVATAPTTCTGESVSELHRARPGCGRGRIASGPPGQEQREAEEDEPDGADEREAVGESGRSAEQGRDVEDAQRDAGGAGDRDDAGDRPHRQQQARAGHEQADGGPDQQQQIAEAHGRRPLSSVITGCRGHRAPSRPAGTRPDSRPDRNSTGETAARGRMRREWRQWGDCRRPGRQRITWVAPSGVGTRPAERWESRRDVCQ